jgi:prophage DNA circulation protein
MGRQARQYIFDAFLVGDDVATQYESLLSVIETNQAQTLIHPTLGSKTVVCAGAEFTQNVAGRARIVEFDEPASRRHRDNHPGIGAAEPGSGNL